MRKAKMIVTLVLFAAMAMMPACESAPAEEHDRDALHVQVKEAVDTFKKKDEGMSKFFESAHGYVVFPSVTKGGAVVGGAHGVGEVYEKGSLIGYAELSQGTFGLQLGGQVYSEIIFFENEATMANFKKGEVALAAQASAVAAKAGASADADYERGVLVFTIGKGGLMAEASVGGQGFKYWPK